MPYVLDNYVSSAPSPQNALDIFRGQWSSRLPPPYESLIAGDTALFEDPRVTWACDKLGGVQEKSILELGPLEGGHSYMLEKAGARSVLSLEGNTNAFLRCLVTKEILGLHRVRFLCGDFRPFLSSCQERFDMIFACGVLYHMLDPIQLLFDISRLTGQLFLWTHYFDSNLIAQHEGIRNRFGPSEQLEFRGLIYEQHRYSYEDSLNWPGFCGGTASSCAWLTRNSILAALVYFGFRVLEISFEDQGHPRGPSFAVVATKD
jgi:hypothetical protein